MQLIGSKAREQLQTHHSQAATQLQVLQQTLSESSLDQSLLSLCSDYFDAVLRGRDWAPSRELSELDEACLEVCGQFTLSVANMGDAPIAALNRHLNADGVYNLMCAIYLIEGSKRLELTLEGVLQ